MKKLLAIIISTLFVTALAQYEGITIDVLTFTGPQIAEPLQRRGAEFSKATGAQVNVTTVPFSELYQKIATDLSTGTNSFDGYVFAPQWMVDYIVPGYLEDLTPRVEADKDIDWEDIGAFFRDFSSTYEGKIYTIPMDGDFQMVYYRTDVLQELGMDPPKTWEDYLAIAAAANGKDMNGDGEADYGSCIGKKKAEQGYWFITSIASSMIQTQGTGHGGFFNPETMEPLYGPNEAFSKALDIYAETLKYGPADELNIGVGDTRGLWTAGRCALTLDWGDIGTLAIAEGSKAADKTGAVILPGSTQVLDRATGKLVTCDDTICPYHVGGVNHAPFAAFGGWSGAINTALDEADKAATYAFFSYVNQAAQSNVDVTIGATGFNPYRISQFTDMTAWKAAGMSEQAAAVYLGAIQDSLNSPNMVLDLRIPQNQRYQQQVLDEKVAQFVAGEITKEEAMQQVYDGWVEINEELGVENQLVAYRATLGVKK
jgi:multiple sugar transport system substrate-binding protein